MIWWEEYVGRYGRYLSWSWESHGPLDYSLLQYSFLPPSNIFFPRHTLFSQSDFLLILIIFIIRGIWGEEIPPSNKKEIESPYEIKIKIDREQIITWTPNHSLPVSPLQPSVKQPLPLSQSTFPQTRNTSNNEPIRPAHPLKINTTPTIISLPHHLLSPLHFWSKFLLII